MVSGLVMLEYLVPTSEIDPCSASNTRKKRRFNFYFRDVIPTYLHVATAREWTSGYLLFNPVQWLSAWIANRIIPEAQKSML